MEETRATLQQRLLEAGVHFGHLKKKWNPKMMPYIFAERKGIHIIDINKTMEGLEETAAALKSVARSGKKILFVATKKQAKEIVTNAAEKVNMPFVTERWLGGMLTNFSTIRRSVKKMQSIEKMLEDGTLENVTKKERLTLQRDHDKMDKVLGGITQLNRIPSAIFIVDIAFEHIAVAEANKLGITTFGMVDTNSDPRKIDFVIPANDDATKSIAVIMDYVIQAIQEGLQERVIDKEQQEEEEDEDREKEIKRLEAEDGEIEEGGKKGSRRRSKDATRPKRQAAAPGKGGRKAAQKED